MHEVGLQSEITAARALLGEFPYRLAALLQAGSDLVDRSRGPGRILTDLLDVPVSGVRFASVERLNRWLAVDIR